MGFFDGNHPRLFGHRGAAGVVPENTIASFSRAIRDGAEYLEFDVHASADGHVVVIHDATLERTTNGAGRVKDHDLAALQRLDAGYKFVPGEGGESGRGRGMRIPTLREVLEAFPAVPVTIEVKQGDPPIAGAVVDAVRSAGATQRVILATAHDEIMSELRPACRDEQIATSFSAGEVAEFLERATLRGFDAYRPPGVALQVPVAWEGISIVTEQTVQAAHRLGLEVHVWTVNEEAEMVRLLDLGVDGLMSDFPARARGVMDRRGS